MRSQREIEEQVTRILTAHGISQPPIPLDRIAAAEGLPIIESSFPSDVSGALIRNGGVSGIAVNCAQSPNRQRFTIAHELAHHLLGHKGEQDHIDWKFTVLRRDGKSSEATDGDEIEANAFAAQLLMPKHMIVADLRNEVGLNGEVELTDERLIALARRYRVSTIAMNYRLINLGLISPT
jgi:Zn-dependent peptidase ImmA (M78 family)